MVLRTRSSLLLAALVAAGGSCDGGVDPVVFSPANVPGCPGPPKSSPWEFANAPADRLISDFEDGSDKLAKVAGRDGLWVLGTDETTTTFFAGPVPDCSVRGQYAAHFTGRGFSDWGANYSAIFRAPTPANKAVAYDGRAYGGISFWAAFGPANPAAFRLPVGLSTLDTAWNSPRCNYPPGCSTDHYVTRVQLTESWQRFQVRFDAMKQEGWPGAPQVPMDREVMVGLVFWPRQAFDIWIDDVRFEP
jgi:hypothetical protein